MSTEPYPERETQDDDRPADEMPDEAFSALLDAPPPAEAIEPPAGEAVPDA